MKRSKNNIGRAVLAVSFLLGGAGLAAAQNKNFPFQPGETVHYAIKKFGVKAGEAALVFNGLEQRNGQSFYHITFTAKALNFLDEENIFMDPETLYPVRVERNLNIFGKKERILETYDHAKGEIRIVKFVRGKEIRQTLQKKGPVDNIYCFLYRFRQEAAVDQKKSFEMKLPTRDVKIEFVKQDELKVGGKTYQTLYLQSDPKEYKLWFDNGAKKVPLRIDGAMGIASTSLVISNYTTPQVDSK